VLSKLLRLGEGRMVKRLKRVAEYVNSLSDDVEKLSDEELRAKTDAPMMECKKALTEADGNMDKAEELLRIKLGNKAGKASGRITAEGVVTAFVDGAAGAMVEINCETDFVTKNDDFIGFANKMAKLIAEKGVDPAVMLLLVALVVLVSLDLLQRWAARRG